MPSFELLPSPFRSAADDRQWALRRALQQINVEIEKASRNGVAIWYPLGEGGANLRVVRLAARESRLLNSRSVHISAGQCRCRGWVGSGCTHCAEVLHRAAALRSTLLGGLLSQPTAAPAAPCCGADRQAGSPAAWLEHELVLAGGSIQRCWEEGTGHSVLGNSSRPLAC
jgi:hypothetical protein